MRNVYQVNKTYIALDLKCNIMGRKEFLNFLDDLKFKRSQIRLKDLNDPIFNNQSKDTMLEDLENQIKQLRKGVYPTSQFQAAS